MNSKDFIQALRKVIREEVRSAVREELSIIGETISESRNTNSRNTTVKQSVIASKPAINKPQYKTNTVKKPYVNNPMLNDILNETAGFPGEGPRAYIEEQINYNDFSEWPTMNRSAAPRMQSNPTAMLPTTDTEGRRIDTSKLAETESGQAVVQALTKDYSALMKAIDKKKGK